MKKVRAISYFLDKDNAKVVHHIGDVLEVDDARADDLVVRFLAEVVPSNESNGGQPANEAVLPFPNQQTDTAHIEEPAETQKEVHSDSGINPIRRRKQR